MAGKLELGDLASYNGPHHPAHKFPIPSSLHPYRKLLDISGFEAIEQDLCLFGMVGIKDPARVEVRDSIALCKKAGIRVFMVTGDNLVTAESIARDVGIFEPSEDISQKSFLGSTFPRFGDT